MVFMSNAPVFAVAAQELSFNHLALVARGLAFLSPTWLWQLERWFLAGCHSRTLCRQQARSHSFLLWKRPLCFSWSFSLGSRLQVWRTSSGLWSCSQGTCYVHHLGVLPLLFSSPLDSPRNEFTHLSGAPVIATATQEKLPDHLAHGAYACSYIAPYIFAYF